MDEQNLDYTTEGCCACCGCSICTYCGKCRGHDCTCIYDDDGNYVSGEND